MPGTHRVLRNPASFQQEMLSKSRAGDTGVKLEVNERSVRAFWGHLGDKDEYIPQWIIRIRTVASTGSGRVRVHVDNGVLGDNIAVAFRGRETPRIIT